MNYKPLTSVNYLVIHCSATRPSQDIGAKEIDRMHRERGFFSIGYHYVIRRNGVIEKGRPDDQPGAHVQGHNHDSLGICMVGGVTEKDITVAEDNFTPAQWQSLHVKLVELHAKYPKANILGHRDLIAMEHGAPKACPSFDVASWLKSSPL